MQLHPVLLSLKNISEGLLLNNMNILVAPDSFKGTLTAKEVCDIVGQAFADTIKENINITKLPVADGGEGLCACFERISEGEMISAEVSGVFAEKMTADYFMLSDKTAVIEMAACAGLPLAGDNKNPELASTFGVGELIKDAVDKGANSILLGLGGSATNDFGIGMAAALGWKFLDESGKRVDPVGKNLIKISKIIPPENPMSIPVTAACDVDNPLYGKNGAAFVFAPQKGADEDMVKRLDEGLKHISDVLIKTLNINVSELKGAGAAGGMGGGAVAFMNAELKRGIDIILDKSDFDKKVKEADLVITGEGRLDFQSTEGKVISGVAQRASVLNKKVIAVCGSKGIGAENIMKCGVSEIYFATETEKPFDEILKNCRYDLYNAAVKSAKSLIKN